MKQAAEREAGGKSPCPTSFSLREDESQREQTVPPLGSDSGNLQRGFFGISPASVWNDSWH